MIVWIGNDDEKKNFSLILNGFANKDWFDRWTNDMIEKNKFNKFWFINQIYLSLNQNRWKMEWEDINM